MYTFLPQKRGPKAKYDWRALHDPGYFFTPCGTEEEAERKRKSIVASFRNAPESARMRITTSAGQFKDPNGDLVYGVMVKRKEGA